MRESEPLPCRLCDGPTRVHLLASFFACGRHVEVEPQVEGWCSRCCAVTKAADEAVAVGT